MSDLIDRKKAIETIACAIWHYPNPSFLSDYDHARELSEDTLKRLPSAEPRCIANIHISQEQLDEAFEKVKADILSVKRKTGKWIGGEWGECSVCGHIGCASDIWDRCKEHYCPNCGAFMGGEEE